MPSYLICPDCGSDLLESLDEDGEILLCDDCGYEFSIAEADFADEEDEEANA